MSGNTLIDSRPPLRLRRIGMLGTFPPRLCGLATFGAALHSQFLAAGEQVMVIAVNDGRATRSSPPQFHELLNGVPTSVRGAARALSRCDVAIVQHEYGIYGGADGDEVVEVLRLADVPTIVVLHTVLRTPTEHQRSVLETICQHATRVVVMSSSARRRLTSTYAVDAAKVVTIPHGAATPPGPAGGDSPATRNRTNLLTWGLLGRGKGIEHMIDAMPGLASLRPRIHYTVAGATHPNVFAQEGDAYRQSLIRSAWANGMASSVCFDDTYRDVPALSELVAGASIVVLPYDSVDQVTSGVLVDAIAAGRPVIATAFPHAVELLSDGAGIVVPHRDPEALTAAVELVVGDTDLWRSMHERATEIAPSLAWSAVAASYLELSDAVAAPETLAAATRRGA